MPLPTIPRNTYPLLPTAYATYWRKADDVDALKPTGRVPVWVAFHDGGQSDRHFPLLLVRVRPQLEVVIEGEFGRSIETAEIERAMRQRLTKPNWPERNWWVSHIVYLAQPSKRQPKSRGQPFGHERFCWGRLPTGKNRSHMLASIPVRRLKLNVHPADKSHQVDLEFEVDRSKQRLAAIREFVTQLSELQRWERRIVHEALGHLLGISYVDSVVSSTNHLDNVRTDSSEAEKTRHYSQLNHTPERFRPVQWLRDPEDVGERRMLQSLLAVTRFPMGGGPDPELSVRPWVPESLRAVVFPTVPMEPAADIALELIPDRKNRSVAVRAVVGALIPYKAGSARDVAPGSS